MSQLLFLLLYKWDWHEQLPFNNIVKKMLVSWSSHLLVQGPWAYFVPPYLVHANDSSNKRITTQEKNTSYYNSNISLCNCEIYLGSFWMQYCSDKPALHNALLLLQPTPWPGLMRMCNNHCSYSLTFFLFWEFLWNLRFSDGCYVLLASHKKLSQKHELQSTF